MHNRNNSSDILEEECIICFYPLKTTSVSIVNCLHKFHEICIKDWFKTQVNNKQKKSCPSCNVGDHIVSTINKESSDISQYKKNCIIF
jgi:hypothetical protein